MNTNLAELLESIGNLPYNWHGEGSVGRKVLLALARHADRMGGFNHTVETGSGKTTLLFSHMSRSHTVFALDAGMSISQVKSSHMFNATNVTYVEGPSQRTLPNHKFEHKHQLVFLDGPHGYPFPDLEYYFLYPTIETGGLLVLDDIKIPSIKRMYDIIRADKMFVLLEVVDENAAFFERTDAPMIDPESCSWWLQGFNIPYFEQVTRAASKGPSRFSGLLKVLSSATPAQIKRCLPQGFKEKLWRNM